MANLQELEQWEDGIYQIETTDPVVGGPDGISNIQAKQLANRTAHLRALLQQAQASLDAVGVEGQNALWAGVERALSEIGLLAREAERDRTVRHQEGEITLYNRGIKNGCALTKSQTANRNLNIAAGVIFMLGREWGVRGADNAAAVPSNDGTATGTAYAYLSLTATGPVLAVTALDATPPATALVLAALTIPAGNTGITDPYLGDVTITTVARQEPGWPVVQTNPPYVDHTFAKRMAGTGYAIACDPVDWSGERPRFGVPATTRAANSVRIYLGGAADAVTLRFVAHLMDQ